jgi:hypothetical protein
MEFIYGFHVIFKIIAFINHLMFVMVKCSVLFEVRPEFISVI